MQGKSSITILISAVAFVVISFLWLLGGFRTFDNNWSDFKFSIRGELDKDENIVIVAIDENSIEKLGRWPWPRQTHAKLINKLMSLGAKAIVFDVLFTEEDKSNIISDTALKTATKKSAKTILGTFFQMGANGQPAKLLLPIGQTNQSASVGFVNIFPEMDGVCRRIPVVMEFEGLFVPSLALAGLSKYYGKPFIEVLKEKNILLDANDELIINYRGGYKMFEYISFYDVMKGKIPRNKIEDKIVLVGGTAAGLFDFKPIPYSPVFPGVEIHANAMSNIMTGNYLRPISALWAFLMLVIFCAASGVFLARMSAWQASFYGVINLAGYLFFSYFLFLKNYAFDFMAPAAGIILCYVGIIIYRFFSEEKEKKYIKKTFGHYLSPHVMDEILKDPTRLKLGGEKQYLTVLFSDIRGFTALSEMLTPEEIVCMLNEYLSYMVRDVFNNDGTLDKFMGDAVMAFWGAPIPQNDHPLRAVRCAIDMVNSLRKLQKKWGAEGKPLFHIGIGVNTGDMVVGNMGSIDRMDYTVIGDNVNLGSRLEGLNKEYGTEIIISESTYNAVKDIIPTKYLGEVKVEGRGKSVKIYGYFLAADISTSPL